MKTLLPLVVMILVPGIVPALLMAQTEPAARPAPDGERPWFQEAQIPIDPELPTLWLIGDSTVRNGRDNGWNGQWGWGNPIRHYFDESRINVQNRAVGGTSSRTFMRDMWPWILEEMKPGDFVIMQFGHNDASPINDESRARGTIRDNSDDYEDIINQLTGQPERVHSYGWYLRQYVKDAEQKGAAEVIICSPIPRNRWDEAGESIGRDSFGEIAREAAEQAGVGFIDLNQRTIEKFKEVGREKVTAEWFPEGETVHPGWYGSVAIAEEVIEGLEDVESSLVDYLKPDPPTDLKNPEGEAR